VAGAAAGGALWWRGRDDEPAPDGRRRDVAGVRTFVVDRRPDAAPLGTVLFLHGGSYTSTVWVRTGLLDAVVAAGWRGVAVDLPGSGETPGGGPAPLDFLIALIEDLDAEPVLVSPSASGRFSLPLLERRPELLSGFVSVAPVGLAEFDPPPGAAMPPSLVVWGTEDAVIDPALEAPFARRLGGRAAPVEGAGHSPYDDHTAEFRRLLVGFLGELAG